MDPKDANDDDRVRRNPELLSTLDVSGPAPAKSGSNTETEEKPETSSAEARRRATMAGKAPLRGRAIPHLDRYRTLRLLGSGSFGEVHRVYDSKLDRTVAMKLMRPDIESAPRFHARFLAEIKLTAALDHPGIVAVHDYGQLPDGRLWFTMREVRGRTLGSVIESAFAVPPAGSASAAPFSRRRLLDVFARVCETMAYAHSAGVIHRDLTPANIMVGEFGEVMVMDWGLARRVGDASSDSGATGAVPGLLYHSLALTQHGDILGTPAYMAPEQARGEVARHGPAADVYALGAILYHVLAGRPPYEGKGARDQVLQGKPPPLADVAPAGVTIPAELAAICARAMAPETTERYADAGALASAITGWLDGAQRRERALAAVEQAMPLLAESAALSAQAVQRRIEASKLLSAVRPFDPVALKAPGWEVGDEAERCERDAILRETQWIQGVYGALAIDPGLPEAHAVLADHYRDKLIEAERMRAQADAARLEVLLRAHDRGRHAAILSGRGALTLVTEPEGAQVTLYRYAVRQRRLMPELVRELGPTPIIELPLDRGSYLLRICAPGHADVNYPVLIERGEHWHGCVPGSTTPYPVPLPRTADVDASEVYVPPGWAWIGGDPNAIDSLPGRRVWLDGFLIGRFPVTQEEYLAFLNELIAAGREGEALAACPRALLEGVSETLIYARDNTRHGRGLFVPEPPAWQPRTPAVQMNWYGAMAYARWRAECTGRAYRLAHELEREKAVRGTDGRLFPWGDYLDATWTCMVSSHAGEIAAANVDDYPADESPYGLRGGAGNTRDWCINLWTLEGPRMEAGRLRIEPAPPESQEYRAVRGGTRISTENLCRAAARFANRPDQYRQMIGLRLVRSYPYGLRG